MKKITMALLLSVLGTILYAQDLHFGAIAGPTLSNVKMSGDGDFIQPKYALGMQVGAFAELPSTDKISFRAELKYMTTGYKYAPEKDDVGYRQKTAYITLPLTAQYTLTDAIKVGIGPFISTKSVAKYKFIAPTGDVDEYDYLEENGGYDYSDADNDEFSAIDFGLGAGLSYQILSKVGVNLYSGHGMSNIFKRESTDRAKGYNRYFSLGLSYHIR